MIEIAFLKEHDQVASTQWGGRQFQMGTHERNQMRLLAKSKP